MYTSPWVWYISHILKQSSHLSDCQLVIGFAAETHDVQDYARKKLVSKSLDFIFANDVSDHSIGFNSEHNAGVLIGRDSDIVLPMSSKRVLAESMIAELSKVLG